MIGPILGDIMKLINHITEIDGQPQNNQVIYLYPTDRSSPIKCLSWLPAKMGRVVQKGSCKYMMLALKLMEAVAKSKRAFLEIDPDNNHDSDDDDPPPDIKDMKTVRVPIKVMVCHCRNRCALKRLRKKHGNSVDCIIYYT